MPINRINMNLEKNSQKDTLQREGVSAVFGCPLPQSILENIDILKGACERMLKAQGSKAEINWRKKDAALHFSIYGLVMPDDYVPNQSWPLSETQIQGIQGALRECGTFDLELEGMGILGMGAISLRVSDSDQLEKLRDSIGSIEGISKERFGSRTKKIVIGRIRAPLTGEDRLCFKAMCDTLKELKIGTLSIDSLEIVHYKNTLLEEEHERVHIS